MSSNNARDDIEDSDTDEDPSDSVFMSAEEELNEDKKRWGKQQLSNMKRRIAGQPSMNHWAELLKSSRQILIGL